MVKPALLLILSLFSPFDFAHALSKAQAIMFGQAFLCSAFSGLVQIRLSLAVAALIAPAAVRAEVLA